MCYRQLRLNYGRLARRVGFTGYGNGSGNTRVDDIKRRSDGRQVRCLWGRLCVWQFVRRGFATSQGQQGYDQMQTHDSLVHELVRDRLGLDFESSCLGGMLAEDEKTGDEADDKTNQE